MVMLLRALLAPYRAWQRWLRSWRFDPDALTPEERVREEYNARYQDWERR